MLTQKDHINIAAIIAAQPIDDDHEPRDAAYYKWDLVDDLARYMAASNPQFDRAPFHAACYGGEGAMSSIPIQIQDEALVSLRNRNEIQACTGCGVYTVPDWHEGGLCPACQPQEIPVVESEPVTVEWCSSQIEAWLGTRAGFMFRDMREYPETMRSLASHLVHNLRDRHEAQKQLRALGATEGE